jgi:predicted HTH transcriptional regulator
MEQSKKTHKFVSPWASQWDFLLHVQAMRRFGEECGESERFEITLAALLLFGKHETLSRLVPAFETLILSRLGTKTIRGNIVENYRELCGSRQALLPSLSPKISLSSIRELIVNAYIHRCYRTNGPILVRVTESSFEVESPGELPAGMQAENLIHCVPIYRNFLMAESCRWIGICDKIGDGINRVYLEALQDGFPFPFFESSRGRFIARVDLESSAEFKAFLKNRSHSLTQLDEILVLRLLWSRGRGSVEEMAIVMQRGREFTCRILEEMARKYMIEPISGEYGSWQLTPQVRRDIEQSIKKDQYSFEELLWGERP